MFHGPTSQCNDDTSVKTLQSWDGFSPSTYSRGALDDLALRLHADRSRHLRYLRGRLPSLEDAEDALQDATLKFIQNAETLNSVEKPEAWVGVSLRRVVVDRYRRAAAQRRMSKALAAEPVEATFDDEDDELLTPAECLKSTLRTLKPAYATILRQVYIEETPLKDVAGRLNLTANNAAVRLHRARSALRETMLHRCQACPLADCWARQRLVPLAAA
jgi:RNA polymerase sigma-70 factor (ECF subfamily)